MHDMAHSCISSGKKWKQNISKQGEILIFMMVTPKKNLGSLTAEHSPKSPTLFQIYTQFTKS